MLSQLCCHCDGFTSFEVFFKVMVGCGFQSSHNHSSLFCTPCALLEVRHHSYQKQVVKLGGKKGRIMGASERWAVRPSVSVTLHICWTIGFQHIQVWRDMNLE